MGNIHLFGHNDKNLVKVGDVVKKYDTKVCTIGTANGKYFAHLHFSISKNHLSIAQLKAYVNGWSRDDVINSYIDPRKIEFDKMIKEPINVGVNGWDWLDWYGRGYHPGVDVNGNGGGNSDLGYEVKSSCDGKVIFAGDWGEGWGKVVLIEEGGEPSVIDCEEIEKELATCKKNLQAEKDYSKGISEELNKSINENNKLKDKLAKVKEIVN